MYILSYSLIIYKIKFVKNTNLSHSEGPVMITPAGCVGYKNFSIYLLNQILRGQRNARYYDRINILSII